MWQPPRIYVSTHMPLVRIFQNIRIILENYVRNACRRLILYAKSVTVIELVSQVTSVKMSNSCLEC